MLSISFLRGHPLKFFVKLSNLFVGEKIKNLKLYAKIWSNTLMFKVFMNSFFGDNRKLLHKSVLMTLVYDLDKARSDHLRCAKDRVNRSQWFKQLKILLKFKNLKKKKLRYFSMTNGLKKNHITRISTISLRNKIRSIILLQTSNYFAK